MKWFLAVYGVITAVLLLQGSVSLDAAGADPHFAIVVFIYWCLPVAAACVISLGRRRLKQLVLIPAISLILTVIVLELLGSWFAPAATLPTLAEGGVASHRLHHELLPDLRMTWSDGEGGQAEIHTNSDGLRTQYEPDTFLNYPLRIAMLGDSYTFGFLLAEDESIPMQVQRLARKHRPDTAVLNAGMLSYSPLLEAQLMRDKVAAYQPHVTLLCLNPTDIGDDFKYAKENTSTAQTLHFPFPEEWTRTDNSLWEQSATCQVLRATRLSEPPIRALNLITGEASVEPGNLRYDYYDFRIEVGGVVEKNHYFINRHPLQETRPFCEATLRNILAVRDACRQIESRFVLVLLPMNYHWNNAESPEDSGRLAGHYTGREPYINVFFEFFGQQRRGLEVCNLKRVFSDARRFPLCFKQDAHYNAAGAEVAAEGILAYLVANGLLER